MRALVVAMVLLVFVVAEADAGTISVAAGVAGDADGTRTVVTYTGAPGERNDLTATRDGAAIVLHDAGAAIATVAPCAAIADDRTVRCTPAEGDRFVQPLGDLGDGDDRADVRLGGVLYGYKAMWLHLGDGDDVATSSSAGQVYGDAGSDTLTGTGGGPGLYGGEGDDVVDAHRANGAFLDGGPGADVLRGGPGHDLLVADLARELPAGACGGARDYVVLEGAARDALPPRDCERVSLLDGEATINARPHRITRTTVVYFKVSGFQRPTVELRSRDGAVLLGRGRLTPYDASTFTLKLNAAGRRAARRHALARIQIAGQPEERFTTRLVA